MVQVGQSENWSPKEKTDHGFSVATKITEDERSRYRLDISELQEQTEYLELFQL